MIDEAVLHSLDCARGRVSRVQTHAAQPASQPSGSDNSGTDIRQQIMKYGEERRTSASVPGWRRSCWDGAAELGLCSLTRFRHELSRCLRPPNVTESHSSQQSMLEGHLMENGCILFTSMQNVPPPSLPTPSTTTTCQYHTSTTCHEKVCPWLLSLAPSLREFELK